MPLTLSVSSQEDEFIIKSKMKVQFTYELYQKWLKSLQEYILMEAYFCHRKVLQSRKLCD